MSLILSRLGVNAFGANKKYSLKTFKNRLVVSVQPSALYTVSKI